MKKTKLLLLALIVMIGQQKLIGQYEETRYIPDFEEISVFGNITVVLTEAETGEIVISSENVLPSKLITKVDENRLKIRFDTGFRPKGRVNVYVPYRKLREIRASAGGRVDVKHILSSYRMVFSAKSGGHIFAEVDLAEIDMQASEGGSLEIVGNTDRIEGRAGTGGQIEAERLKSEYAQIRLSTGGHAQIQVKEKLIAKVHTGGHLRYRGSPEYEEIRTSVGAKVTNLGGS